MTGLNFVKSVRERLVTLSCLAFISLASLGLASCSEAQTATATATIEWDIHGYGWALDTPDVSDDGGNYSGSGSDVPWSVTSTVHIGDMVTWREGLFEIQQTFLVAPYTGAYPVLDYTSTSTVDASIGSSYQRANSYATEAWDENDQHKSGGIHADVSGDQHTDHDEGAVEYIWTGLPSGFTITAYIFASAWEMEEAL